jgi:hypothetical protein
MGGAAKAVKKIVKGVVKFVGSLFSGVFGWLSPSIPQYDNRSDYDSYAQGTYINKQSNSSHIPVVYGRKRIGGTRVFVHTQGDNNEYLYVVTVLAEGECEKIEKVIVDDTEIKQITNAGGLTHGSVFEVTQGKYAVGGSRLKVQGFFGKEDQGKASLLDGVTGWSEKHRLRGICYIVARYEWRKASKNELEDQINNNPYSGLPTMQVVLKGKKVRKLTTLSEAEAEAFSETYAQSVAHADFGWSENPAECLFDYLRNPRFGKGLDADSIDTTRFRLAANDCGQDKTFTLENGSSSVKPFLTTNITIDTSKKMLDNTKALLECCRGYLPYTNGRYALKLEAAVSTSGLFEVNDMMIIGKITLSSNNKSNTYNRAEVSFSNEREEYETDVRTYENTAYITEDEGEVLEIKHNSPGITDEERAYDQARLLVERSRKQMKLQFQGTAELQQLEAGDIFKFTHQYVLAPQSADDYMYNEGLFRVLQLKVNWDQTVTVTAVEHDNSLYNVEVYQIPVLQSRNPKRFPPDDGSEPPVVRPPDDPAKPTPPKEDNLLESPNFTYELSVFDNPQLGTAGKAHVRMNYSGMSSHVARFRTVLKFNGQTQQNAIFNIYHTAANNLSITGSLDPGVYKITGIGIGSSGQEKVFFEDRTVNINPRGGGSSVITASAAVEGFA